MTKAQTIAEEIYFEIEFAEDAPEHFWGEDTVIEFAVKVAEKYLESQLKPQEGKRDEEVKPVCIVCGYFYCKCKKPTPPKG